MNVFVFLQVSVSCGIPDFCSRDGVYARLNKDYPSLPHPQSIQTHGLSSNLHGRFGRDSSNPPCVIGEFGWTFLCVEKDHTNILYVQKLQLQVGP